MDETERIARLDVFNEISHLANDALTKLESKSHYLWFLDQLITILETEEARVEP